VKYRHGVGAGFAAALTIATAAGAQESHDVRTFIACPVYRDTDNGRKSGCWLATENSTGTRFDISQSRVKPQLGHAVLVEGVVSQSADQPCGAAALLPAQVSVLEQTCASVMIPAEGFPGRPAHVDPRQVLPPADTVRPAPEPPFVSQSWSIEFAYLSEFLQYQYSEVILDEIARYALAGHPRQLIITGFAVTTPRVVDSLILREPQALARSRADMTAEALRRLQVPSQLLQIRTGVNPLPLTYPQALPLSSQRRVEIKVLF